MIETAKLARIQEEIVLTDCSAKFLKISFLGPFSSRFRPKIVIFQQKNGQNGPKNENFKNLALQSVKTISPCIVANFAVSITKTLGEDRFLVIFQKMRLKLRFSNSQSKN